MLRIKHIEDITNLLGSYLVRLNQKKRKKKKLKDEGKNTEEDGEKKGD
jgi:hypothetical protein